MDLEGWSTRLKVFADATRVRLLALLEREELTVAELSAITRLAQPRVSTHLAKLKEAGLVRDRRAGVSAYYRFDEDSLDPAQRALWQTLRNGSDDPCCARTPNAFAGVLADARGRPELGRLGGRRHGTPLFAGPHVGSARAHRAAPAASRRRAGHRLGRRRARRTARAAFATAMSASMPARAWWPPRANASSPSRTSKCARATCMRCRFPDASFDLVVLMHALTYASKPAQAVAEAARVLRRGGRLLLSSLARHEHRAVVEAYGHANLGLHGEGTAQVRRKGRARASRAAAPSRANAARPISKCCPCWESNRERRHARSRPCPGATPRASPRWKPRSRNASSSSTARWAR